MYFVMSVVFLIPLSIGIALDYGAAAPQSIGDVYDGRELPLEVAMLVNNVTMCPTTGRSILQQDNNQVFLVPVG